MEENVKRTAEFPRGLRAGVPIAIGYFPMSVAFGVLAIQAGLSVAQAFGMSVFVFAGASQFAALSFIAGGASALAIALATLVLNFRHFLMSVSLSRLLPNERAGRTPWLASLGLGFGVTDETFVVASLDETPTPAYFAGLELAAYLAWILGTLVGACFALLIPPVLANALGIALYAMFIAILVPGIKKSWLNGVVAAAGGAIAWGISLAVPAIPSGWRIVIAILAASALGAAVSREDA